MEDQPYRMLEHRRQLTATARQALDRMVAPGVKVYLETGTSAASPYVLVLRFIFDGLDDEGRQDELLRELWEEPARPLARGRTARQRLDTRSVRYRYPLTDQP